MPSGLDRRRTRPLRFGRPEGIKEPAQETIECRPLSHRNEYGGAARRVLKVERRPSTQRGHHAPRVRACRSITRFCRLSAKKYPVCLYVRSVSRQRGDPPFRSVVAPSGKTRVLKRQIYERS